MQELWRAYSEIERGNITDSTFAANVWLLYKKDPSVPERYKNPTEFFKRTYWTPSLREIVESVLQRVYSGHGNGVFLLQTTFGGGKTHTLIAVYHAVQNPGEYYKTLETIEITPSVVPNSIKPIVVAFDGQALDPVHLKHKYQADTLWEYLFREILRQESGATFIKDFLERYSDPFSDPGSDVLQEIIVQLEKIGKPVVFLLDELSDYVDRLRSKSERKSRAAVRFIDSLARAVASSNNSVLLVAIPEIPSMERVNRILVDMIKRVGRMSIPRILVGKDEAVHVLTRALLEEVGNPTKHVKNLMDIYNRFSELLPSNVTKEAYRERMLESAPFHPLYVDVLYDKLLSLDYLQSTRDALRLTAYILHELAKRGERRIILLSDMNLISKRILDILVPPSRLGKLRKAIETDLQIIRELDNKRVRRGETPIYSKIYSTIAVYSIVGESITKDIITLATCDGRIEPPDVSVHLDALLRDHRITYLHKHDDKYIVRERASWRRIIDLRVEKVTENDALVEFYERLNEAMKKWGRYSFSFVGRVESAQQIPDNETLKLVIVDPKIIVINGGSKEEAKKIIERFIKYANWVNEEPRVYRNTVYFLLAEENAYERAIDLAKRIIAARIILESKKELGLERSDVDEIDKAKRTWQEELKDVAADVFRYLAWPLKGERGRIFVEIKEIGDTNPISAAYQYLLREEKKFVDKIDPTILLENIIIPYYEQQKHEPLTLRKLIELFARDPEKPFVLQPRRVLRDAISALVLEGKLVLVKDGGSVIMYRSTSVDETDLIFPPKTALEMGYCIKDVNGKILPKPPSDIENPIWDDEQKIWVAGEHVEEPSSETVKKPHEQLLEQEERKQKIIKSVLEQATLQKVVEEFSKFVGKNVLIRQIEFRGKGETHDDVKKISQFLKTITNLLRGIDLDIYINAEMGEPEKNIHITLEGQVNADWLNSTLDAIGRLAPYSISFKMRARGSPLDTFVKKINVKLLTGAERFRGVRLDVTYKLQLEESEN